MTQITKRWRPQSFYDLAKSKGMDEVLKQLDTAMRISFDAHYTLENQLGVTTPPITGTAVTQDYLGIKPVSANQKLAFGHSTVTGSLASVVTGLATVVEVVAVIDNGAAALNEWLSVRPSTLPGDIDIFVWKPNAANDTTPIASTTARTVRWMAKGT